MRLKYKLSILFLIVIAAGASITLFLVSRSTESMFRSFVFAGDSEKAKIYATLLAEYHGERKSWDGVQDFLFKLPDMLTDTVDSHIHGQNGLTAIGGYPAAALRMLIEDRVVVADMRGVIVADTAERTLRTVHPGKHLSHGIPITENFRRVGTVLVGSMVDSSLSGVDEQFLSSVAGSLLWSTAVSAAIALLLGIVFAARITKPLGNLARAAKSVAAGGAAAPVPVAGRDEVAALSTAFNEMTAELRRLDAAKKQVIADAAHELRTPVTLIKGMIEGMVDGVFPRDDRTLQSVCEETVRLAKLIDTLRELEIIESGELALSLEGVDLNEAATKAVALFKPQASEKSINLCRDNRSARPSVVRGDYLRLEEVLYNLVSNAIKYTPSGGTVRLRILEASPETVSFSVDDSGPGIPVEERPRIFERFYRIDKSRASNTGGRGLGLAIASEIVKAHDGSITVESSSLGGASFVVTLPRYVE